MALPSSGSLSIKRAAGVTRSISLEVDGNETGNKSLNTLGITAGLDASGGTTMLEFYGYSSVTIPSAPSSHSITEDNPSGDIDGTFTDNSSGSEQETAFEIQYSYNGGSWTSIADNAPDDTTYVMSPSSLESAVNGDSWRCRVRATNSAGSSSWITSNIISSLAYQPE